METHKKEHLELHSTEIARLASVTIPDHIKESPLAQQFMSNRYTVRLSRYAFELLLAFLQDNKFMLLTRLLNRNVTIRVDNERPSALVREEAIGLSELNPSQLEEHNKQPVQLGALPADPWMIAELEYYLRDEKFDAEPLRDELRKLIKREGGEDTPSRDAVPMPPPKFTDVKKEVEALKELREKLNRQKATTTKSITPSITCFTFHNTYDTLTCLTASADSSLVCAGFSESILKIWSLKGEKLKAYQQHGTNKEITREVEGSDSKRLVGHSGPVYGARISGDKKFAISCSEDTTVRLWSLETFTNLVVYKGHNYP
ncbi:Transcription initiation factor TFIID subunit 5, partial [Physocladia obscura]